MTGTSRKGVRALRTAAVALGLLGALASTSFAGEPAAARSACIASVFKLCPMAALAGDHDAAKACLLKNLDKAASRCQVAVRAVLATDTTPRSPG